MGKQSTHRSGAWRIATLLGTFAVFAWGMAAYIFVGTGGVSAEANPQFRDIETILTVPQDGEWYTVKISFFMFDDGTANFDEAADTAREEMIARFPGSFEVAPGSVTAAFVTSGFKWMDGSADWSYNGDGAPDEVAGDAHQAMNSAASTWGQVGGNFQFTGGGTSSAGTGACGGGTDGANTVGWDAQSGSVLAVTCSWFSNQGNPFKPAVEFDMEFDPDWNWTTGGSTTVDLESVALHEFGHALGLNHSSTGGAVMFASYSSGTQNRTPSADDVQGLLAIYGAQGGGGEPTATPTEEPTEDPTEEPTQQPTSTPTPPQGGGGGQDPTPTNTPFPTNPPGGGGGFPTSTPSASPSATATPTRTNTPGPSPTATPTKTPTVPPPSLPIVPGANLLAWPGGSLPPAQALAGLENQITIVYSWDPVSGTWQRFGPGLPWYLNTMPTMQKGNAYWFIAKSAGSILFEE